MKYLYLRVLVLLFFVAGLSPCAALRLEEYKPVPSRRADVERVVQPVHSPKPGRSLPVEVGPADSGRMPNQCTLLRDYMERLAHIYYNSSNAKEDRRLTLLKSKYRPLVDQTLSRDLVAELEQYEELCRCMHDMRASGLSMPEIYARRSCGRTTTKEKRLEIIAKCRSCPPLASSE
ncbi:MAG: hypothetical protein HY914_12815 [Desulfomonile tiedjei]|nr:hypothetical protein [Desulfomonile tiedjei]